MAEEKGSSRPIAIDFFAGAGGLALGFEQAGFDVVAAVEIDPIHAAVHQLNFPSTTVLCRDIKQLSGDQIRKESGIGRRPIDVVIGGPPCQGFSLIGNRVLDDARNSLVFHFLRLVTELRPKCFVMENVPGMATGAHNRLLDELIERFQTAGYRLKVPYSILNAADYGVPQSRRRLFLLGSRRGVDVPEYPAKIVAPVSKNGTPAAKLELALGSSLPIGPTVFDAISDLPDIETFDELWETDVLRTQLSGGSIYSRRLRGDARDPGDFSFRRVRQPTLLSGCLRANHTEESRRRFRETEPGTTEPISRFYRLPAGGLCNTLRAGTASDHGAFTSPRPIHPTAARCISVREAARLHSYPDWFRFHRTIWHGFRQIGNSVPPLLGRAVGAQVLRALHVEPSRPSQVMEMGADALSSLNMRAAAEMFGVDPSVIAPRRRVAAMESR